MSRIADNALPKEPGEFAWQTDAADGVRRIGFVTPCGHFHNLPVNTPNGWQWDGNEDAPTLTPSILCRTPVEWKECGWHGYLTNGQLREV